MNVKARLSLWSLIGLTALLYLWGLGSAGWANEYYAAAAQAGTQSWKALLFGSLDAGNSITVDKPPASLWVMGLSGRLFGFGHWSMLVPQALMGVAAVVLVYGAVRRVSGHGAGLLAGAVLALTPVATLMFRYNNPDALLVLLLVVAAYCVIRALESAPLRWTVLAGAALGFAFLSKLLQALLVSPAIAAVVLVALPGGMWARIRTLCAGLAAMVISAGWYVALVSLWPSNFRPHIGGSTDNSLIELTLGYNGLGRVFGGNGNPIGLSPGAPGDSTPPMFGGQTGLTRLFGSEMGTEISWLLPAALIGLAAAMWQTRRAPRTDRLRGALLLWGGWLLVTALVFSFMKGIMHPYYTVALAPAVAALVGTGVIELWRRRQSASARWTLAVMLAVTGVWTFVLLWRTPDWLPGLRWVLLVMALALAAVVGLSAQRSGRWTAMLAATGLLVGLGGAAAYTVDTVFAGGSGPIPVSGPHRFQPVGQGPVDGPRAADDTALIDLIERTDNRWAAATVGSHTAAVLELATGASVMSIGGFNGGDPSPTLQQFQSYVAQRQIRYFVASPEDHRGPGPESAVGAEITRWVKQVFIPREVGGTEVYDLTVSC